MSETAAGRDGEEITANLLPLYDANVYCGHYPFRALPAADPDSLKHLLTRMQLSGAVITPFESIFYRQPLAGLEPWLRLDLKLPFKPKFWLVVNPLDPGWDNDVILAAKEPAIAGVRLFPRYHGYQLHHPDVARVATVCSEVGLPVNLTARLLDDRLHPYPLRVDDPLAMEAVDQLLQGSAETTWVLSMFTMAELQSVRGTVAANPRIFLDIGCSKPFEFWEDDVRALAPVPQLIYGSGAPLYYYLGNRISFSRFSYPADELAAIAVNNISTLLENATRSKSMS